MSRARKGARKARLWLALAAVIVLAGCATGAEEGNRGQPLCCGGELWQFQKLP